MTGVGAVLLQGYLTSNTLVTQGYHFSPYAASSSPAAKSSSGTGSTSAGASQFDGSAEESQFFLVFD